MRRHKKLSDYVYLRKHISQKEYWSYMLMLVVVLAMQILRIVSLGFIDSNLNLGIMRWQLRIWYREEHKRKAKQ